MWIKRAQGKLSIAPKWSHLPPTSEAFSQNVLRAHYQCAVWKSCLLADPPSIDPTKVCNLISCCIELILFCSLGFVQFGWIQSEESETLVAVMVAEGVQVIPDEVSRVLACSCKATEQCKRGNCSLLYHSRYHVLSFVHVVSICQNEWTSEKALCCELESDSEEA